MVLEKGKHESLGKPQRSAGRMSDHLRDKHLLDTCETSQEVLLLVSEQSVTQCDKSSHLARLGP